MSWVEQQSHVHLYSQRKHALQPMTIMYSLRFYIPEELLNLTWFWQQSFPLQVFVFMLEVFVVLLQALFSCFKLLTSSCNFLVSFRSTGWIIFAHVLQLLIVTWMHSIIYSIFLIALHAASFIAPIAIHAIITIDKGSRTMRTCTYILRQATWLTIHLVTIITALDHGWTLRAVNTLTRSTQANRKEIIIAALHLWQ